MILLFQMFYRKYDSYSCDICNKDKVWEAEPKVFEADDSDSDSDIEIL